MSSEEHPRKKIRLDDTQNIHDDKELQKEIRCGITAFISPNTPGFSGVLKQRFTDFLVNEIVPSGQVLHLNAIATSSRQQTKEVEQSNASKTFSSDRDHVVKLIEPQPGESELKLNGADGEHEIDSKISKEYRENLVAIFGEKVATAIEILDKDILKHPGRKRKDFKNVISEPIQDKDARTKAHQAIRKIFSSRLETTTGEGNTISISRSLSIRNDQERQEARHAGQGRSRGRLGWEELGGEYLHFTLYKENRDTMEAIHYLATQMKLNNRHFAFAGTKDRRAVTVQRVSVFRVQADRLVAIGRNLRGTKIGDFKYEKYPLVLGQLQGNEFVITLRGCHFPGEENLSFEDKKVLAYSVVEKAGLSLQSNGFINYYGLQRFGSFSTSTDEIGMALLRGDLKSAVNLILSYSPSVLDAAKSGEESTTIPSDDRNRALAIHTWETTKESQKALDIMPRKFSAESSIIRHFGYTKGGKRVNQNDFQGALSNIQRSLRLMYVHAYQSLVWNTVAGRRWERFGSQVVEGDLIVVDTSNRNEDREVDESGELIVRPSEDDRAIGEDTFTRARPLTEAEAKSGSWTIWDIVLPLPGYDVEYPKNEIGQFYAEFMGSSRGGGLDPRNMRRKWKDISLSGGYRNFLAKPPKMSWDVKSYIGDIDQLVETDMDRILQTSTHLKHGQETMKSEEESAEITKKLAVIVKMQLGSSQYATMALREMLKTGGLKPYMAEFSKER